MSRLPLDKNLEDITVLPCMQSHRRKPDTFKNRHRTYVIVFYSPGHKMVKIVFIDARPYFLNICSCTYDQFINALINSIGYDIGTQNFRRFFILVN